MIKRDLLGLQSKLAESGGLSVLENDPSSKTPHFQNEAKCTNEFYLLENEKSFPYQRLST